MLDRHRPLWEIPQLFGARSHDLRNGPVIEVIWRDIHRQQEKISRAKAEIEHLKAELRELGIENPQTF